MITVRTVAAIYFDEKQNLQNYIMNTEKYLDNSEKLGVMENII